MRIWKVSASRVAYCVIAALTFIGPVFSAATVEIVQPEGNICELAQDTDQIFEAVMRIDGEEVPGGDVQWLWDFADETTSTDNPATHRYGETADYLVTVVGTYGEEYAAAEVLVCVPDAPSGASSWTAVVRPGPAETSISLPYDFMGESMTVYPAGAIGPHGVCIVTELFIDPPYIPAQFNPIPGGPPAKASMKQTVGGPNSVPVVFVFAPVWKARANELTPGWHTIAAQTRANYSEDDWPPGVWRVLSVASRAFYVQP